MPKRYASPPPMTVDPNMGYTATLKTTEGDITIQLLPKEAPITVNNFVFLAKDNFYDGVKFHRVIKGFMVQTGDPLGNGTGGPGYGQRRAEYQRKPVLHHARRLLRPPAQELHHLRAGNRRTGRGR